MAWQQSTCLDCGNQLGNWSINFQVPNGIVCLFCHNLRKQNAVRPSPPPAVNQLPQTCSLCGGPNPGIHLGACRTCLNRFIQNAPSNIPKSQRPIDPWEAKEPKINNDLIKWKEHFEGIGMPWNFYESLLLAAKSLREGRPQSCAIDKDGWFILKYENQWIKLKISEITVEPPG
jgi:hypothetical protein